MDRYLIHVAGHLDRRRADALGCAGLRLSPDGNSVLVFEALDQAALFGLLARLRDAGLALVRLERQTEATAPTRVGPVDAGDTRRTSGKES